MPLTLRDAADRTGRTLVPTGWLRLARRKDRIGKLARLAIEVLTEARYRDGEMVARGRRVALKRGESLVSLTRLSGEMECKRTTVRNHLDAIAADLGWEHAPLMADSERILGTVPGDPGGYPGSNIVGHLVTITNYDRIQRFGDPLIHRGGTVPGDPGGDHIPSCSSLPGDPIQKENLSPTPSLEGKREKTAFEKQIREERSRQAVALCKIGEKP